MFNFLIIHYAFNIFLLIFFIFYKNQHFLKTIFFEKTLPTGENGYEVQPWILYMRLTISTVALCTHL